MRRGCPYKTAKGVCIAGGPGDGANDPSGSRATLKRFVAAWMKGHGHPLKIVAREIGVAESTISQWAHGRRFPKPEELDSLARCANVATGCLFCPALAKVYEENDRANAF